MPQFYSLIIGFTKRTSYSLAKALLEKGENIIISDTAFDEEKKSLLKDLKIKGTLIDLLGNQSPGILDQYPVNLVLPSPGVPLSIPLIKEAKKRGIPVLGDIELFYESYPHNTYIGITGTDGKTTTTTLTHEMIKKEKNALIGGNVGIPIFEYYQTIKNDSILVLELSSFQLEAIREFRPKIAALLNIAEDHLDRYDSLKSYIKAKKNIFMNQNKDDFAVLNLDSPFYKTIKKGLKSNILTFSISSAKADIYFKNKCIYLHGNKFIDRDDIKLKGIHNVENAMASILTASYSGVSDSAIITTLREFSGLEHRLEFVRELSGVEFYNDSKSTTVNALEKALLSFDRPVILIAGGRDKGLDFTKIRKLAHQKLKELVLIGEASEKIKKELDFEPCYEARDLSDAVHHSIKASRAGDIIIVSPGCASFDMFKNYEERGKKFKEIVMSL